MSNRQQNRIGATSLLLLGVLFVVAVVVSNQLFKGLRVDLTENNLYTLSDGTRRIVSSIDEPINLYFFFSDSATESSPRLRDYANRVREMLEEFRDASRGKIALSIIDPLPFSEDEDRAAQFGLEDVPIGGAPDPVYLGLAGTNSVGDEEVIPFFPPDRETTLEYDIAKLVSTLANPERRAIGLVAGVSLTGGFDPQTQRMREPWVVYEQASQLFDIRDLGLAFDTVPEDIGLLWIVQPKTLSDETQYAIDQFVMRGGKAVIFVDPVAAADPMQAQGMPQGMPPMGQSSDLPRLFEGWGIQYDATEVVADSRLALPISNGRDPRPIRHYGYLGITPEQMNDQDLVTAELSNVNAATAGHISLADDSSLTLEPLLISSSESQIMPASRFSFLPDPSTLQDDFAPGGDVMVIGARISGELESAFPNGSPEPPLPDSAPADTVADPAGDDDRHLASSTAPANLIVVADVDLLSDPMWVQVQRFFGQMLANPFASNGAFAVNALENLAGSSDLIAVRSRESFARPFTRVESLRAEAEARFLETEERLEEELAETERRLAELEASREDGGSLLLTEEQEAEIDRFIDQRTAIRKELRAVQRGLDKDIEDLGTRLKAINIGLVPLLLTLGTLFVAWRRRRQET